MDSDFLRWRQSWELQNRHRNGFGTKRTVEMPGGIATVRKSTLARRVSAGAPSISTVHQGYQRSPSTASLPLGRLDPQEHLDRRAIGDAGRGLRGSPPA